MVKKSFEKILKSIFCVLILGFFSIPVFSLEVPALNTPVTDKADVINSSEEKELNRFLTNLSNETGIQVAVLTIPSLEGEALESYSMKVVEDWKLGQKGKDNGVLLLVSVGDKEIRIETGYGVEGDLTDTKCGLIIRNVITPHFKSGDYSTGIVQGVHSIVQNVAGDFSENGEIIEINEEDEEFPGVVIGFFLVFISTVLLGSKNKGGVYKNNSNGMLKTAIMTKAAMEIAKAISSKDDDNHFGGFGGFGGGSSFGGFSGGGGGFGGGGASGSW